MKHSIFNLLLASVSITHFRYTQVQARPHSRHPRALAARLFSMPDIPGNSTDAEVPAASNKVAPLNATKASSLTSDRALVALHTYDRSLCVELEPELFDVDLIAKIKNNLAASGNASWTAGARIEALLEFDTPTLAVYSSTYYYNALRGKVMNQQVNDIAKTWLDRLPLDSRAMVNDTGAAGDSAAIGVGFVNAGVSGRPISDRERYRIHAGREVDYLLHDVGRIGRAISHRPPNEAPQAWNDFVYMAPPFLAYWGVLNNNITIAREAYRQIKAYRKLMRDPVTGFWRHVSNKGQWEDVNHWSTGISWVAAGITRVYATISNGPFALTLSLEMEDLKNWANEIVASTFAKQNPYSGLLPNAYNSGANSSWDDTASSALLASVAFRLAQHNVLDNASAVMAQAAFMRQGVRGAVNEVTGWMYAADPLV